MEDRKIVKVGTSEGRRRKGRGGERRKGRGGERRKGKGGKMRRVEKRMKEGDENGDITNYKASTHCKEKFLTGSKLIS